MSFRGPTVASAGVNLGKTVELTFTLATNFTAFTFMLVTYVYSPKALVRN